jgi:hypothetical protein
MNFGMYSTLYHIYIITLYLYIFNNVIIVLYVGTVEYCSLLFNMCIRL